MSDQAEKLRRMSKATNVEPCDAPSALPMVVVSGAKNGVGTTTVTVNLAAAMADRGARVLVVDAAESGNELADMAGVARDVEHCAADVMSGKCSVLDAAVAGPMGMQVLANRGRIASRSERESRRGSAMGSENSRDGQQRLLSSIDSVAGEIDLVLVDAGWGVTAWTRRLWLRAQCVVLVTTADDVSVMDAYAAMKASTAAGIRPTVRLLVNREINGAAVEDAQRRVQTACRKFLSLSIDALPALPLHDGDFIAGASERPRVWEEPNSAFSRATLWLGRAVGEVLAGETFGPAKVRGQEPRAQHGEIRAQQAEARTQQMLTPTPVEMFLQAADRVATY